jgi:hypothetical protein
MLCHEHLFIAAVGVLGAAFLVFELPEFRPEQFAE